MLHASICRAQWVVQALLHNGLCNVCTNVLSRTCVRASVMDRPVSNPDENALRISRYQTLVSNIRGEIQRQNQDQEIRSLELANTRIVSREQDKQALLAAGYARYCCPTLITFVCLGIMLLGCGVHACAKYHRHLHTNASTLRACLINFCWSNPVI